MHSAHTYSGSHGWFNDERTQASPSNVPSRQWWKTHEPLAMCDDSNEFSAHFFYDSRVSVVCNFFPLNLIALAIPVRADRERTIRYFEQIFLLRGIRGICCSFSVRIQRISSVPTGKLRLNCRNAMRATLCNFGLSTKEIIHICFAREQEKKKQKQLE